MWQRTQEGETVKAATNRTVVLGLAFRKSWVSGQDLERQCQEGDLQKKEGQRRRLEIEDSSGTQSPTLLKIRPSQSDPHPLSFSFLIDKTGKIKSSCSPHLPPSLLPSPLPLCPLFPSLSLFFSPSFSHPASPLPNPPLSPPSSPSLSPYPTPLLSSSLVLPVSWFLSVAGFTGPLEDNAFSIRALVTVLSWLKNRCDLYQVV